KYDTIPIIKEELSGLRKIFINDKSLTLYDYQNARLRGFLHRDKILRLANLVPELSGELQDRARYFYTKVSKLSKTECESMCVEVSNGRRFIQNGFPFSNSQGDEW